MLRIKAERIKDLEKFGFEKDFNMYSERKCSCDPAWLIVDARNRQIEMVGFIEFSFDKTRILEKFFALLNADMVEEVTE